MQKACLAYRLASGAEMDLRKACPAPDIVEWIWLLLQAQSTSKEQTVFPGRFNLPKRILTRLNPRSL